MTPVGSIGVCALAVAAGLVAAASLFAPSPAAAQGGIVCAYGPASYQRCCRESYAKKSRMGSSARADDIDACMGKKPSKKKG